jgi:hypothetical protein
LEIHPLFLPEAQATLAVCVAGLGQVQDLQARLFRQAQPRLGPLAAAKKFR